jgi:HAD superfamily hydrolase (TIGR01509 family)
MATALPFDLVIFDCDGVLVDSEMLSARVLMALLQEVGIAMTFDEFRDDFLGRGFATATARLKARTGQIVPDNFQHNYFSNLLALFETDLHPMTGVHSVLQALSVPHCVASSSIPPRLDFALRKCGLEAHFGPHVFSAEHVKHAKPAPDLFFHAAQAFGVSPDRCLVIEDSEMGVRAAHAAGMQVWHFAGGAHIKAGYALPDELPVALVLQDMAQLQHAFQQIGLCQSSPIAAALAEGSL